jgi:hypothetical protein
MIGAANFCPPLQKVSGHKEGIAEEVLLKCERSLEEEEDLHHSSHIRLIRR